MRTNSLCNKCIIQCNKNKLQCNLKPTKSGNKTIWSTIAAPHNRIIPFNLILSEVQQLFMDYKTTKAATASVHQQQPKTLSAKELLKRPAEVLDQHSNRSVNNKTVKIFSLKMDRGLNPSLRRSQGTKAMAVSGLCKVRRSILSKLKIPLRCPITILSIDVSWRSRAQRYVYFLIEFSTFGRNLPIFCQR
mmetsp:Transcript_7746/g.10875  ORF Transcript_7746/g.10875 Transcript_7746/m.10875 type:complete len:190 (-) Transcript_7746:60-629(-)